MTATPSNCLSDLESARAFAPYLSPYIPHEPFPKQLAFLMLRTREAFFGGAAGGGKSDALFMGALQHVEIPGYSAMILRKTFADLRKFGALIDRSHAWLTGTGAVWKSQEHAWYFPPGEQWARMGYQHGGRLAFGYLDNDQDIYNYDGSNFHYIAFDEASQFWRSQYEYLFSRVRRSRCPIEAHQEKPDIKRCSSCREFWPSSKIPLRVRCASNPPAAQHPGQYWLAEHFLVRLDPETGIYRGFHPTRAYIPAFADDNKALDVEEYNESLEVLDPVTRERLKKGDWGVTTKGLFAADWARYYSVNGIYVCLSPNRQAPIWKIADCRCIQVIDPAASSREGPRDEEIWKKEPSSTVISTFLITPRFDIIWWDCNRFQKEIPDIFGEVKQGYQKFRPEYILCESNGLGIGVYQSLLRMGLPVRAVNRSSVDKVVHATDAMNRMQNGQVYLPSRNMSDGRAERWLEPLEKELFTWIGHKEQAADQIDTLAHIAREVSSLASSLETEFPADAMPSAVDFGGASWGQVRSPW